MAFSTVGEGLPAGADHVAAVWRHYEDARFLYPAKLERLQPALGLIRAGWPQLLAAPSQLFDFHAAVRDGRIVASICAYRDTAETYVVQHAASTGHPREMLDCIIACLGAINADPRFGFARMYFRPENRWPARAAQAIADAIGPDRSTFTTQDYLYGEPLRAPGIYAQAGRDECPVGEASAAQYHQIAALATATVGPLRAAALGLAQEDVPLLGLNADFLRVGLRRIRRVLVVEEGGSIAGVALCHVSAIPMNFSFLCSRTELLVHPRVADRARIVRTLARASLADAAARGDPLAVLVAAAEDAPAAIEAGYRPTHKQYRSFLWAREDERGAPSALRGVRTLYERATHHAERGRAASHTARAARND
jgi:hypothetical protein